MLLFYTNIMMLGSKAFDPMITIQRVRGQEMVWHCQCTAKKDTLDFCRQKQIDRDMEPSTRSERMTIHHGY